MTDLAADDDTLVSPKTAADLLDVTPKTILRRIADGSLAAYDIAPVGATRATWRLRRGDVLALGRRHDADGWAAREAS